MEFVKSFESTEARLGAAGPLLVALYRGSPSPAVLDELERVEGALLERYPRISSLTVIGQASSMLKVNELVRARSVELSKKFDDKLVGSAIVVATQGVAAVVVRSFLSGFFLLSRAKTPMKTFSEVGESLKWLRTLPDQDPALKALNLADLERFLA